MNFKTYFTAEASDWFSGEPDYDIKEESEDKDEAVRLVLAQLVEFGYNLPNTLYVKSYKVTTLTTEDGDEEFKSKPLIVAAIPHQEIMSHPVYQTLGAEKAQRQAEEAAAKKAEAEAKAKAARLKIYNEVKAELEKKP